MSPVYNYHCKNCGLEWEAFHHIEGRHAEACCGNKAALLISKVQGKPVTYNYFSENLDAHITGRRQKRRVMKEKNLEEK